MATNGSLLLLLPFFFFLRLRRDCCVLLQLLSAATTCCSISNTVVSSCSSPQRKGTAATQHPGGPLLMVRSADSVGGADGEFPCRRRLEVLPPPVGLCLLCFVFLVDTAVVLRSTLGWVTFVRTSSRSVRTVSLACSAAAATSPVRPTPHPNSTTVLVAALLLPLLLSLPRRSPPRDWNKFAIIPFSSMTWQSLDGSTMLCLLEDELLLLFLF